MLLWLTCDWKILISPWSNWIIHFLSFSFCAFHTFGSCRSIFLFEFCTNFQSHSRNDGRILFCRIHTFLCRLLAACVYANVFAAAVWKCDGENLLWKCANRLARLSIRVHLKDIKWNVCFIHTTLRITLFKMHIICTLCDF